MSKYIDRDRVLEYIIFGVVGKDITCGELTRAIDSIPTINIVRCKDCKHGEYREDFDNYLCDQLGLGSVNDADFFCSYGERKDYE